MTEPLIKRLLFSVFILFSLGFVPGDFVRETDKIFNPYLRDVKTDSTTRSAASYSPTTKPPPSASTSRVNRRPVTIPERACPVECFCKSDLRSGKSAVCTSKRRISSFIPNLHQTLNVLEFIGLNQTKLDVKMFRRFSVLKKLSLRNNNIKYIPTNAFEGLGLLAELDLGHNALAETEDETEKMFEGLRNIASLNLECNDFRWIPKAQLETLKNLERLNLHGNLIEDVTRTPLQMDDFELVSLFHLNLSSNYIRTMYQLPLGPMDELLTLDLGFNYISTIWPNSFENMPNLGALLLGGNQLDSIDAQVFSHLKHLKILDLKNNKFNYVTDGMFSYIWKLQYVGLDRNPLTCDCKLDWIQAVLHGSFTDNYPWAKKWLRNEKDNEGNSITGTPTCVLPASMADLPLDNFTIGDFTCSKPYVITANATYLFISENEVSKIEVMMWGGLPTASWLFSNQLQLERGQTHNFTERNGSISIVEERLYPGTLIRTTAHLIRVPPTISGTVVVAANNSNATRREYFHLTVDDRYATTTAVITTDAPPSSPLVVGLGVTVAFICFVVVVIAMLFWKRRRHSRVSEEMMELTSRPRSSAAFDLAGTAGEGDNSDRDPLMAVETRTEEPEEETQEEEEDEVAAGYEMQGRTTSRDDGRPELQTTEACPNEEQSNETVL